MASTPSTSASTPILSDLRDWHSWRETCAGLRRRIAKNPTPALEFLRPICWPARRLQLRPIWYRFGRCLRWPALPPDLIFPVAHGFNSQHVGFYPYTLRSPGLAFMEGNMRGPSTQDCEKSYARTGVPSANLLARKAAPASANLVQIRAMPTLAGATA